ncbi:hypothetical protein BW155_12795, partial [Lactococcus lactis subsp. lactis]|uniref:hypothetical protein n=1 Tax=Lactococcus lactis TaxID=1358 RepID=UPI000C009FBD
LCPLCLFSQFYTKIDFLENFATEPLYLFRLLYLRIENKILLNFINNELTKFNKVYSIELFLVSGIIGIVGVQ